MHLGEITSILGGSKAFRRSITTPMDLVDLGDRGVTKAALVSLANHLGLTLGEIAKFLHVTERTIQRYSPQRHFNRIVSERILQLARVAARGSAVFGDKQRFRAWLDEPNLSLGGRTPLSLLISQFGIEMILDDLGRIEHGVVS